jgi:hypothetical protein
MNNNFLFLVLFIFCFSIVSSVEMEISLDKESYTTGDEVVLTVLLTQEAGSEYFGSISANVLNGDELNRNNYFEYFEENVRVDSGEVKEITYLFVVSGSISTGKYDANVVLRDLITNEVLQGKVNFDVVGVKKTLSIDLDGCGDVDCNNKRKVFTKGERAFLDYSSNVEGVEVVATLKNPLGSVQAITLPYNFVALDVGTYELLAVAVKDGYKDASLVRQFSVIEKTAEIAKIDFNDIPVSEPPTKKVARDSGGSVPIILDEDVVQNEGSFDVGWIIVLIVFFLIVIFIIVFWLRRKR